jgi:hypothetical protein
MTSPLHFVFFSISSHRHLEKTMACFEYLSNDLLFEIFDYLPFNNIFYALFGLQQRLDKVIRAYPAYIHLTTASYHSLLENGPFLCRSLVVSNISLKDFGRDSSYFNFESIRSIKFKDTDYSTILSISDRLPMEQLKSITIKNLNGRCDTENIDQQIWSTIAVAGSNQLRYLHVPLHTICQGVKQLSLCMPSLEYAILKSISGDEMFVFLHHTPKLCSFTASITYFDSDNDMTKLNLARLTYLNLRIEKNASFESLSQFLSACPNLTHLEFRCWTTMVDQETMDPANWQQLIEQYLPHLLHLQVRFFRYTTVEPDGYLENVCKTTDYWRDRQPDFRIEVR